MKAISRNPFLRALSLSTTATVVLTFGAFTASAADLYWDIDGETGGAGGAAPSGNWDDANWSTSANGDVATDVWGAGPHAAIFSAGADAVDAFTDGGGAIVSDDAGGHADDQRERGIADCRRDDFQHCGNDDDFGGCDGWRD